MVSDTAAAQGCWVQQNSPCSKRWLAQLQSGLGAPMHEHRTPEKV